MLEEDSVERTAYEAEIEGWRRRMEESLRAERGWLALAGLFWLEEGPNRFGAAADNPIVLPGGSAPEHAGSFTLHHGMVTLQPEADGITMNGQPATPAQLRSDAEGNAELIAIGDLTMRLLRRGERYAIRLWDRRNPAREAFAGRHWYPIDEAYRLPARFIAHDPPRTLPVPNVLGETEQRPSPGYALFSLGGREHSLDAVIDGDELFFIFRDKTAGDTTYPAGRFLKAAYPVDGQITLDFNRAYSPPCAFTAYATCPLPPPGNHLPLRIEAGELDDHSHG
ncbi:MAG TPA: DUF1684 domain-containing protein [Roseiflexaceae bacterium]|nr:DUF1684 domain-containing protein [Roseiflexaceae bacterium]